ncbi:hypothetical protein [Paenarthrobacter sp. NPDC018779]|uniref:hypothetical protein n=1 Tax=Paenarthrobacter sp. NPDC018779 TaxID=3364375 RepID=UPI0037C81598
MCTAHNHDQATAGQAAGQSHKDTHTHSHDAVKLEHEPDDLAECPVMPGNMVVKSDADADGMYRDYNGTRYYLCCETCVALMDADPSQYAKVR